MAKEYKDLIVGLDIGTAKIMVVVGEVLPGPRVGLARVRVADVRGEELQCARLGAGVGRKQRRHGRGRQKFKLCRGEHRRRKVCD